MISKLNGNQLRIKSLNSLSCLFGTFNERVWFYSAKPTRQTKSKPKKADKNLKKNLKLVKPKKISGGDNQSNSHIYDQLVSLGLMTKYEIKEIKSQSNIPKSFNSSIQYIQSTKKDEICSPFINDHKTEDLEKVFPVNKYAVPGEFAGKITNIFKRQKFDGILLRKHMLELREIMNAVQIQSKKIDRKVMKDLKKMEKTPSQKLNMFLEDYEETILSKGSPQIINVTGTNGRGKSVLLNYAIMHAVQQNWLVLSIPRAQRYVKLPYMIKKASDRPHIYYQVEASREFFRFIEKTQKSSLKKIRLKKTYSRKSNETNSSAAKTNHKLKDKAETKKPFLKNKNQSNQIVEEISAEDYERMLFNDKNNKSSKEKESKDDKTGLKKEIISEMKEIFTLSGETAFHTKIKNGQSMTLLDMVQHGISNECPNPASLLYDFLEEINLCEELPVLIAIDNVNHWGIKSEFQNTTGNNLFASQLSIVDAFWQYLGESWPKNGLVVLADDDKIPKLRFNKMFDFELPDGYSSNEMQEILRHYKYTGLLQSSEGDNLKRIELLSGRNPKEVSRIVELY